jgi:MFS transporter, PAT family, beta-lactamase induction signal transducer AmpG
VLGLGRSLWIFGLLQIFSNLGYVLVAGAPPSRPLMYGAVGFETFTSGLGTGAFSVLLLRMTEKRFSATQYALFSSLFALPRLFSGPVAGFTVDAVGWSWFFWGTILAGIPGMLLLSRFVPLGVREPTFTVEELERRDPLTAAGLVLRAVLGLVGGTALGATCAAGLAALKEFTRDPAAGFALGEAYRGILMPEGIVDSVQLVGILVFGILSGLFVAAAAAARRGMGLDLKG